MIVAADKAISEGAAKLTQHERRSSRPCYRTRELHPASRLSTTVAGGQAPRAWQPPTLDLRGAWVDLVRLRAARLLSGCSNLM